MKLEPGKPIVSPERARRPELIHHNDAPVQASMFGSWITERSILRIVLITGEVIEGLLTRVDRFTLLIRRYDITEGRAVVLFKHGIVLMEPTGSFAKSSPGVNGFPKVVDATPATI